MNASKPNTEQKGISRERFAILFEEHSRLFWVVAAGVTGSRDRAADLVQDAAIVALGKLDQYQEGTSFQAWMSQIVRYVALNDSRKHRPTLSENAVLEATASRAGGALAGGTLAGGALAGGTLAGGLRTGGGSTSTDQEAFSDEVIKALATLGPVARECVLLKVVFDWSYARIAEFLDIPDGTAMSHVHRSRGALRKLLATSYGGTRAGGDA